MKVEVYLYDTPEGPRYRDDDYLKIRRLAPGDRLTVRYSNGSVMNLWVVLMPDLLDRCKECSLNTFDDAILCAQSNCHLGFVYKSMDTILEEL